MFDSVQSAVRAHRVAAAAHHQARDQRDYPGMDAAADRIRQACDHLRANQRAELIFPLTMEWVTAGRDAAGSARYRAVVEALLAGSTVPP